MTSENVLFIANKTSTLSCSSLNGDNMNVRLLNTSHFQSYGLRNKGNCSAIGSNPATAQKHKRESTASSLRQEYMALFRRSLAPTLIATCGSKKDSWTLVLNLTLGSKWFSLTKTQEILRNISRNQKVSKRNQGKLIGS